jgi:hypothetical protein
VAGSKKKSGKRRSRKSAPALGAVLTAFALRLAAADNQASDGELVVVLDVDPEQPTRKTVVAEGNEDECIEWLKAAPGGRLYIIAQLGAVKGFAK